MGRTKKRTKEQIDFDISTQTKYCPDCQERKPMDLFSIFRGKVDGRMSRCKVCDLKAQAKWRKMNPDKARLRDRKRALKAAYGMTPEDYAKLYVNQGGACLICGETDTGSSAAFNMAIDHCHTTGTIRGLLCSRCNLGLGKFRDSPELLRKAADYIESYNTGKLNEYLQNQK